MSGKLLEKYTGRATPAGEVDTVSDTDDTENLGAYGWLRGVRDRAISLELSKKNGDILAINYGWIERVQFEPSEGITLYAGSQKIRIKGRNLNGEVRPQIRLFQGIARQKVPWIIEADQSGLLQANKGTVVVEAIEW